MQKQIRLLIMFYTKYNKYSEANGTKYSRAEQVKFEEDSF